MSARLLVALPGAEDMTSRLADRLGAEIAEMAYRQFPDGESYLRFLTSPAGRDVLLIAALERPDSKIPRLLFAAAGARDLGASRIGLVAPYLPYMRQDARFAPGEVITSKAFASQVSAAVDWLVTVDPHLHRWTSLDQLYTVPSRVVEAAPALADWIGNTVDRPVLIGPDSESEQWVAAVARRIGAPHVVLSKTRHGDRDVSIDASALGAWPAATPVLVDDTISSARTMIEAVKAICAQGLGAPVCCAVHGLHDANALAALRAAGPAAIVTTNTIASDTAAFDISGLIAAALHAERPDAAGS